MNVCKLSLIHIFAETINFGLDNDSEVIVEIYDTNGNLVSSQNLGVKNAGLNSFLWNGRDNNGTLLADVYKRQQIRK